MLTINLSPQETADLKRMYHVIKNMYRMSVTKDFVTDQKMMVATLAAVKVLRDEDITSPILVGQEEECRKTLRAIEI